MTLLQPSFRGRLRLFFAVIVVVPIIAIGVVLFRVIAADDTSRLDARLSVAQAGARNLYTQSRNEGRRVAGQIAKDPRLSQAIIDEEDADLQRRVEELAREYETTWLELEANGREFPAGTPQVAITAVALPLEDTGGKPRGQITVSTTTAQAYAENVKDVLEVQARVDKDGKVLASTLASAAAVRMPATKGSDLKIGDQDYRTTLFRATEPDGGLVTVSLFTPIIDEDETLPVIVTILTLGFLALAFLFAVIVSRTLREEVERLLHAAQRLGRGDFSVSVPAEGSDEFAALGKEFNRMALQLEARVEDLRKERGRLQEAIRRVGESFARGLDREGVLEIVVQTAVDGVGASAGRATMRRRADAPMEEVTRSGEPEAFHRALHAAEAAVMDAGEVAEIQIGGASAMAAPLSATEAGDRVLAIVSVARGDRPFAQPERELFAYLTSQAAVSVENVDLHETVQRQAVTDELTGLFNHRRFQEVMAAEVERARRYDAEMGLIMLDIDNFKRVNDTYGHMQGDMVLREVARVLRQSAREIDEPARYGGEEMAVALPQTDLDGAYRFAERVRQRIEALELPLLDGDGILRVTASFGAASLSSAPQSDKEGLVAAADAALYRAKRSGKNRTVKAE